jgi:hypothetical protein
MPEHFFDDSIEVGIVSFEDLFDGGNAVLVFGF